MKPNVASKQSPKSVDMGLPYIPDGSKTRPSISMNSPLHYSSGADMMTHADLSTTNQSLINHKNLMILSSRNTSLHRSHLSNEEFLKSISSNIALTNIIEKNNLLENIQVNTENNSKTKNSSFFQRLEQISGIYQPNELIGKFKENMFKRFDFRKKGFYDDNEAKKLNEKKDESTKEERIKKISFTTLSRISDRKSGDFNFSPNSYNFFDFNTPNNRNKSNASNGKISLKKFFSPGMGHRKTKTEIPNLKNNLEHKMINKTSVFLDNAKKTLDRNIIPRNRSSERKKSEEKKNDFNEIFIKHNGGDLSKNEKYIKIDFTPTNQEEHVNKNNNNNVNMNIINDNLKKPLTPEKKETIKEEENTKIKKKIGLKFQSLGIILDLVRPENLEKEEVQEEKGEKGEKEEVKDQVESPEIISKEQVIDHSKESNAQTNLCEKEENGETKEEEEGGTNEKDKIEDSQEKSLKNEITNDSKRNSQNIDLIPLIRNEKDLEILFNNGIQKAKSSSSTRSLSPQAKGQNEGAEEDPELNELNTPFFLSQPPFSRTVHKIEEIQNNFQYSNLESKHLIEKCKEAFKQESNSDFGDSIEELRKFSLMPSPLIKIPLCGSEVQISYPKTTSENSEERKEKEEIVNPISLIYAKNISDKVKSSFFFKNSKRNSLKDNITRKNSLLRKFHKGSSFSQILRKGRSEENLDFQAEKLDLKTLVSQTTKNPEKSSNSEEVSDISSHQVKKTTELNSKFNTQQTFEHEEEKKNNDTSEISQNSGVGTQKEGESDIVRSAYVDKILNSSAASLKMETPKDEANQKESSPLSLPNDGPISPIIDFSELQHRLTSPTFLKNKSNASKQTSLFMMNEDRKGTSIENFLVFKSEQKDNENKENEIEQSKLAFPAPIHLEMSQTSLTSVSPIQVLNDFEFYPSAHLSDEVLEHAGCEKKLENQVENEKQVTIQEEEKERSQNSFPNSSSNNDLHIALDSTSKLKPEKPIILINNRDANELNHLDPRFMMDRSAPIHNRRNIRMPTAVVTELKRNRSARSLNKSNLSDKSRDNKLDLKKKISDLDISPISSIKNFSYEDFDGFSDFNSELSLQLNEKINEEFKGMLNPQFSPLKAPHFNRNFGRNKVVSLYQGFMERLNRFFEEKNKKTDFFYNKPLEEDITKSADNKFQAKNSKNDPSNSVMEPRSRRTYQKEINKVESFDNKLVRGFRKTIVFAKFKKKFSQSLRSLNTEAIAKKSFEDDKSSISEEAEIDSQEEEGFKIIKQKILEHEKLLNMNFIYQNLKNIKSIAKEDFFIYLEEYISNNYQYYKVNKHMEQEFQDHLLINERVGPKRENIMTSFFYDEGKDVKFKIKLKEECELVLEPLFLSDEIDYKEYFYHTDLKNLKFVIDGDFDDNLSGEDPFSTSFLFDKSPIDDHLCTEKKSPSLLSVNNNKLLMSPQQIISRRRSNFYSNKNALFINDEEDFSNENSQVMGNRIKNNMEMNYFIINQKINKFIEVFEQINVCIRTRFDYETLKSLLALKLELGKNEMNQVFDENDADQNKYFSIQKLGKAYLSINKENFRKFCEEHRDILFGYFEDYYHEIIQTVDFEGEKRKNITFLVQGLPLHVSKFFSMKINKNKSQISSEHEKFIKNQKSASFGAFLASRKKNIKSESNSNKTSPITELNIPFTESLEDQRKQFQIVLTDLQEGNEVEISEKDAKMRSKSGDGLKKQGTKRNLLASVTHDNKRKAAFEESKKSDKSLLTPKDAPKLIRQKSSRSLDVLKAQAQAHMDKTSPKSYGDDFNRLNKDKECGSSGLRKKNEEEEREGGSTSGFFTKGILNPLTKNLMSFNTYMIHLRKKKDLNVLEQFFFAIKEEKYNELEELIVNYPNILIDERDKENNTMLINAVRVGSLEMVNLILSKGPNLNLRNNEGNTALHYSLGYGYDKITNILLRNGAIETIKNNEGKRPWDMVDYS